MRYIMAMLCAWMPWLIFANEVFPPDCKPLAINSEELLLVTAHPSLVMIHNLHNSDLWMTTHTAKNFSASSHHLTPGNWSAIAFSGKKLTFSCIESKPGHEQPIACQDVLAVCQWAIIAKPAKYRSNIWAGEDRPLSELIAYIERIGFEFSAFRS